MTDKSNISRRDFIRDGSVASLGLSAGLAALNPLRAFAGDPNAALSEEDRAAMRKTRSYNSNLEYRRLGKTGLWVSAVCMGGHWKRIDKMIGAKADLSPYDAPTEATVVPAFEQNRREVLNHCFEVGINWIDFAGDSEPEVYSKIIREQREKVYIGYSHPASELRVPENRSAKKLLELLDAGLKRCRLEYVDLWRLMALERGGRHTQGEVDAMLEALVTARKQGKCRFTGMSTHDREWAKGVIEAHPDVIQVLVFPYTADTRELPEDSLFETLKKHQVGTFGIKPFASNAIFKGDGSPTGPFVAEDDRRARLVIRNILSNPAITAPIPGLMSTHQVDNIVLAIKERHDLDFSERMDLKQINREMWANLTPDYQWLKEWKYV
jgi:predicted aldo/keto reductase-like oxidoreductase